MKRRDPQIAIEHHKDHVHDLDQVGQVAVHFGQLGIAVLHLFVDGDQFLVGGLQLLFRGFQLFVGALQLFVAGKDLFVGRLQLLIGGFLFFNDGAQIVLRSGQFPAQGREFALGTAKLAFALPLAARPSAAAFSGGAVSNNTR